MQTQFGKKQNERRDFLKMTGISAAGTLLGATTLNVPYVHAAESNTLKIALVGCGGRGGGALVNALETEGPKKLVAMADIFPRKITGLLRAITESYGNSIDVPSDRQFSGFDGYRKAIDAVGSGGVVLLGTPPVFRPMEFEYAVERGVHVFMEKSFGVDAPGVRRVLKAGKVADAKNLKVVTGLMSRHKVSLQHAVEQIHSGIIGDVTTCWAYRMHPPFGLQPRLENESLVSHHIRNFNNFTWVSGSPMLDWLIHNLDVCCWAKNAYPVSAQGHWSRQFRAEKDQLRDLYAPEYTFPDGTRLFAQGRYIQGAWHCFQATIHGTTGCAVIGEGVHQPVIFKGHNPVSDNLIWTYTGAPFRHEFQAEHDTLFDCIRKDKTHNETERSCMSAMVGILGRMAAESGQVVSWEDAFNSTQELVPNIEQLTLDGPAPVEPDENGDYLFPMPGETAVF